MYKFLNLCWIVVLSAVCLPTMAKDAGTYGLGRAATETDIAVWDIDVRFDGAGLPAGNGNVAQGEMLFDAKCSACHGDFGQGEGRWPPLAGGNDTLRHQGADGRPEKTVGSYWPYVPPLFDYIRRAMPYAAPKTLTDEETYALVAYVLRLNEIVGDNFTANAQSLPQIVMPNRDNFFFDPRPDSPNTACMEDCVDTGTLRLIESITGVTPSEHLGINKESSAEKIINVGAVHYKASCAVCHAAGVAGAPREGDSVEWKRRLQVGGEAALIDSVISGKGLMPPRGGGAHLSDEDITAAARYLIRLEKSN
jgi:cytochrome c